VSSVAVAERPVSFLKKSRNGIVIASMVLRCHSPNFLKRGHAFERLFDSDHPQGFHSFGHRLVLDHRGRSALDDQPTDRFAHWQRFNHRRPSGVTATLAAVASGSVIENDV